MCVCMCVYGGGGREVRAGSAGRSSGGEWNVSQEAFSALQRQDEGVCCWCCCSDTHRPAGELTSDTVILTHTYILRSVTPHRLGRGVQLLYPVVDQPTAASLDISPHCVVVEERETDRVSHCSCFSSDTSEGKGEDKEEGRGEGLTGTG